MNRKASTRKCTALKVSAFLATLVMSSTTYADVVKIDFEGLGDFEYVSEFYNGGFNGAGKGPGPDYGVSFSQGNAYSSVNGGSYGANFGGQLTPGVAVSFQQFSPYINVASGFQDTFSFYYGNPNNNSSISFYSGVNGTGQLLATLFLPRTGYEALPGGGGRFDMEYASITFSGIAKSVDFAGMAHSGYIDDITLITSAVPEPETYAMMLGGLGILGFMARRRKQQNA